MECNKCKKEIPDGAPYCCWCGKKQQTKKATKRGNGTGSVYRRNDKWVAEITRGYREENGTMKRVVSRKCGFRTKKKRSIICRRWPGRRSAIRLSHSGNYTKRGSLRIALESPRWIVTKPQKNTFTISNFGSSPILRSTICKSAWMNARRAAAQRKI